jgi:hypothetical protein
MRQEKGDGDWRRETREERITEKGERRQEKGVQTGEGRWEKKRVEIEEEGRPEICRLKKVIITACSIT